MNRERRHRGMQHCACGLPTLAELGTAVLQLTNAGVVMNVRIPKSATKTDVSKKFSHREDWVEGDAGLEKLAQALFAQTVD